MSAFTKIAGLFPAKTGLGEAVAGEILADHQNEVAEWIIADPALKAAVAGSVACALGVLGHDGDAKSVDTVMLAVMPEISEALKSRSVEK